MPHVCNETCFFALVATLVLQWRVVASHKASLYAVTCLPAKPTVTTLQMHRQQHGGMEQFCGVVSRGIL